MATGDTFVMQRETFRREERYVHADALVMSMWRYELCLQEKRPIVPVHMELVRTIVATPAIITSMAAAAELHLSNRVFTFVSSTTSTAQGAWKAAIFLAYVRRTVSRVQSYILISDAPFDTDHHTYA